MRQQALEGLAAERLAGLHVVVVGAGAIGNEVVKNLALMGVGRIDVCDFDRVELHNLTRSIFLREADVGRSKAAAVAERAAEVDPNVRVRAVEGDAWRTLTLSALAQLRRAGRGGRQPRSADEALAARAPGRRGPRQCRHRRSLRHGGDLSPRRERRPAPATSVTCRRAPIARSPNATRAGGCAARCSPRPRCPPPRSPRASPVPSRCRPCCAWATRPARVASWSTRVPGPRRCRRSPATRPARAAASSCPGRDGWRPADDWQRALAIARAARERASGSPTR